MMMVETKTATRVKRATRVKSPDLSGLDAVQRAAARGAYMHLLDAGADVVPGSAEVHWTPGAYSVIRPFGPQPFTWGEVIRVHAIGADRIVEFVREPSANAEEGTLPRVAFSCYPGGVDASSSCDSLDRAVIFCVAWRRLGEHQSRGAQLNDGHRQVANFMRMTGPGR